MKKGERNVVDRKQVVEAFIIEPEHSEEREKWGLNHGWQVGLVLSNSVRKSIDLNSEEECIELINDIIPNQIIIK